MNCYVPCVLTSKIARHRKSILHAGSVSYPRFFSSKHCDTTIAISPKALLADSESTFNSIRKNRKYIMLFTFSFGHFLIWLTKPCPGFFWHEKLRPSLKNESKKAGQRQLLQPFAMGSLLWLAALEVHTIRWEIQPYLTRSQWNMGDYFSLKFHL